MTVLTSVRTASYTDLQALLLQLEGSGTGPLPPGHLYFDTASPQLVTMGTGFNLTDRASFFAVLRGFGWSVPLATSSPDELTAWLATPQGIDALAMLSDIRAAQPGGEAALETALNILMAKWATPGSGRSAVFYYSGPGDAQANKTFGELTKLKDNELGKLFTYFGMPANTLLGTSERNALLSIVYNSRVRTKTNTPDYAGHPGILGLPSLIVNADGTSKLMTAIANGNRAEAWYQIRYGSGPQYARRFKESDVFGLFESSAPSLDDAIGAFSMYNAHYNDIAEANISVQTATLQHGKTTAADLQPAFDLAIQDFVAPLKAFISTLSKDQRDSPALQAILHFNPINGFAAENQVDVNVPTLGGGASSQSAIIFGSLGNKADHLTGGKGNDLFIPGHVADAIQGGGGFDTVSYANSSDGVNIAVNGGKGSGGDAQGDTLSGISTLVGSSHNDTLIGGGGNFIFGGDGDDRLSDSGGSNHLYGGSGNDVILANEGDVVDGGAGDDLIITKSSYNVLPTIVFGAGSGHDYIQGSDFLTSEIVSHQSVVSQTGDYSIDVVGNGLSADDVKLVWNYTTIPYIGVYGYGSILSGFTLSGSIALTIDGNTSDSLYLGNLNYFDLFDVDSSGSTLLIVDRPPIDLGKITIKINGVDTTIQLGIASEDLPIENAGSIEPDNGIGNVVQGSGGLFPIALSETLDAGAGPASGGDDGSSDPNPTGTSRPVVGDSAAANAAAKVPVDPLVIDLSGNGLNLTSDTIGGVHFDWSGSGFASSTGWIGNGTAFLAVGSIDDGIPAIAEILGADGVSGFDSLSSFDADSNGVINASDGSIFNDLVIWQDRNGNGIVDPGEVDLLSDLAQSISITPQTLNQSINGNQVSQAALVTMLDGTQREIASVDFDTQPTYSQYTGDVTVSVDAAAMPQLSGYGNLPNLQVAMTQNADLLSAVQDLMTVPLDDLYTFDTSLGSILYQWANVDGVSPTSRGFLFDGQKLAFIESFVGEEFQASDGGTNPSSEAEAQTLDVIWNGIIQAMRGRILIQNPSSALSDVFSLDADTDAITPVGDFSTVVSDIAANAPSDPDAAISYWALALSVLSSSVADYGASEGASELLSSTLSAAAPSAFSASVLAGVAAGTMTYVNIEYGNSGWENGPNGTVYGSENAELFNVDDNREFIVGGGGGDEFLVGLNPDVYGVGIDEEPGASKNPNVLYFSSDISTSDVATTLNSDGSVTLTVDGTEDITLYNEQDLSGGIQEIVFADGTVWSQESLLTPSTTGTSGDDNLYGDVGPDTFDGEGGSDFEVGNGGGDSFIFNSGYGFLEISEVDGGEAPSNKLVLGSGILTSDVTVSDDASGNIFLTIGSGGDQILLDGMLSNSQAGVQEIDFSGGTVWTATDVIEKATIGTSLSDTLYGNQGANVFEGNGGGDLEVGNGGGDTFEFNIGDGALEIDEQDADGSPSNVLQFGSGISPVDVTAAIDGQDVILSVAGGSDQVVIDGMVEGGGAGVQAVSFSGGTTWTAQEVLALATTNSVEGTTGDDALTGAVGSDVFDGLGGNDVETGGGGNDVFIYDVGYGHLAINETDFSANPNNELQFGAGIAPTDVSVSADTSGNVILTIGSGGDVITIDGLLNSVLNGVQTISFSNGTTWHRDDLIAMAIGGTSGDDIVYGTAGDDVIDAKGGTDVVYGRGGSDQFVFDQGYGHLEISENQPDGSAASATLTFGAGISPGDVSISVDQNGNAVLTVGDDGDIVTIDGMANDASAGVQYITFSDETVWSRQAIETAPKRNLGSAADDTFTGSQSGEYYDGRGGSDIVNGLGGDTIIYDPGYGSLEIAEPTTQALPTTLRLGAGIDPTDVNVVDDDAGNIVLEIGSDGDQITLDRMIEHPGPLNVDFNDGTVWDVSDIYSKLTPTYVTGTTGNDFLPGTDGPNIYDGLGGDDHIEDFSGGDTFIFNEGYGTLELDVQSAYGADDVLQLGSGIIPSDVSLSSSFGDVYLTDTSTGDVIRLDGFLGGPSFSLQDVDFSDGTIWTYQDILTSLLTGTTGADTINGSDDADLIDGKGALSGSDEITGHGGGDTIIFNSGYGMLYLTEVDNASAPNDVLQLGSGILPSDVKVSGAAGDAIILTIGSSGDEIVIEGMDASPKNGVQSISFADSTVWTRSDILEKATTGTTSDETLNGSTGADTFDGKGGLDVEAGYGGGDTFVFNSGYGQLEIDESDAGASPNNVLQLGAGILPSDVTVSGGTNGDIILTIGISGDQITLDREELSGSGIQSVAFSGGTTWSRSELLVASTVGTTGADELYGSASSDTFDGLGGSDLEVGNGGGDTFVFDTGYGALKINEVDGGSTPNNVLEFGSGIDPSDVSVSRTSEDVVLTVDGGTDIVTLHNMLASLANGVQSVTFSDATTWSRQDIGNLLTTGTTGEDFIDSIGVASTYDGKGGGDAYVGSGQGDTFVFDAGYGQLSIEGPDSAGSVLELGGGISSLSIAATPSGPDVVITDGVVGDGITFRLDGIATIAFDNGITWDAGRLDALLHKVNGTSGDDDLGSSQSTSFFDGKGGNDIVRSTGSEDVFLFNSGYGQLEVDTSTATPNGKDVLQLGSGISDTDVSMSSDAAGDLILTIGTEGDSVKLDGQLLGGGRGINSVEFSDGTVWSREELVLPSLVATTGNDNLFGTDDADTFDGLGGNDLEVGYGGGDTFTFNSGYGFLEVEETDPPSSVDNSLALGAGIMPFDVDVSDSNGNIDLGIGLNGEEVELDGMMNDAKSGVQAITFENGVTWSRSDVLSHIGILHVDGTAADETLYGTSNADVIDGDGGDDRLVGYGGGDTFVFKTGYGHLEVDEHDTATTPSNTLAFGSDIETGDVTVQSDGNGNIILTVGIDNDQVTLDGMAENTAFGVQSVAFADGTIWDRSAILGLAEPVTILGTTGNDVLSGAVGSDTFDGAGGSDVEFGDGGDDIFKFDAGYGTLEIAESDSNPSADNVLQLGSGISVADVSVAAGVNGDLLISDSDGDTIDLDNELYDPQSGVQSVLFSDSTLWDRQDLLDAATTAGTTGDDTLTGTSAAELFDGKGGQDLIVGNGGSDTFLFNAGYGALEITEYDQNPYANNAVIMGTGINATDITVSNDGFGDAVLFDNVTEDVVVLDGEIYSSQWGAQQIKFSDGTNWTRDDLIHSSVVGTTGDDTLNGTSGNEIFDGLGGNDVEGGWAGGNDTFMFNQGYGYLEVQQVVSDPAASTNTLVLGPGIDPNNISVSIDNFGDYLLYDNSTDDILFLDAEAASSHAGVQKIFFVETGDTWTRDDLINKGTVGTSGSDTLTGSSASEVLDGKAGNDAIAGGGGNDYYLFKPGDGQDTVDNTGGSGSHGQLEFSSDFSDEDLWFKQTGNDLVIQRIGSTDKVTVSGWFGSDSSAQLSEITLDGNEEIDSQLNSLISAMATYSTGHGTFNPATATVMPTDTTLHAAIAGSWHG